MAPAEWASVAARAGTVLSWQWHDTIGIARCAARGQSILPPSTTVSANTHFEENFQVVGSRLLERGISPRAYRWRDSRGQPLPSARRFSKASHSRTGKLIHSSKTLKCSRRNRSSVCQGTRLRRCVRPHACLRSNTLLESTMRTAQQLCSAAHHSSALWWRGSYVFVVFMVIGSLRAAMSRLA